MNTHQNEGSYKTRSSDTKNMGINNTHEMQPPQRVGSTQYEMENKTNGDEAIDSRERLRRSERLKKKRRLNYNERFNDTKMESKEKISEKTYPLVKELDNKKLNSLPSAVIIKAVRQAVNKTVNKKKINLSKRTSKRLNCKKDGLRLKKKSNCTCDKTITSDSGTRDEKTIRTCNCTTSAPSFVLGNKCDSNPEEIEENLSKYSEKTDEVSLISATTIHNGNPFEKTFERKICMNYPKNRSGINCAKGFDSQNNRQIILNKRRGLISKNKNSNELWCFCDNLRDKKLSRTRKILKKVNSDNDTYSKADTNFTSPFTQKFDIFNSRSLYKNPTRQKLLSNLQDYINYKMGEKNNTSRFKCKKQLPFL